VFLIKVDYFSFDFILSLALWTYRQSYTEMPNGAPTTMIISKHDKDDSDDSFASDEASDLSVQLGITVILLAWYNKLAANPST